MDQPDEAPAGTGCCDAFARLQKMAAEAAAVRGQAAGSGSDSDSAAESAPSPFGASA